MKLNTEYADLNVQTFVTVSHMTLQFSGKLSSRLQE